MSVQHDADRSRFVIATGEDEAVLEYQRQGRRVTFTHTFVPPPLRGRGLAEELTRAGLEWARETGLAVDSTCSYVSRFLERYPEYRGE